MRSRWYNIIILGILAILIAILANFETVLKLIIIISFIISFLVILLFSLRHHIITLGILVLFIVILLNLEKIIVFTFLVILLVILLYIIYSFMIYIGAGIRSIFFKIFGSKKNKSNQLIHRSLYFLKYLVQKRIFIISIIHMIIIIEPII
jgi:hypothetical protein